MTGIKTILVQNRVKGEKDRICTVKKLVCS